MKRKFIIPIILLVMMILILFVLLYMYINNSTKIEEDFVSEITTMGSDIYTNYYYQIISSDKTKEETIEYLKKYESMGLTFDLEEMSNYSEDYKNKIDDFISKNTDCKKRNIMMIIYPKSPYTNTSFTSEVKMNCNYKK